MLSYLWRGKTPSDKQSSVLDSLQADMAEPYLTPVLQGVLDRLSSPLLQKLGALWNLQDNLQELRSTLQTLQANLEDLQQMGNNDGGVGMWSSVIKQFAGAAEDLLDELSINGGLGEQRSGVEVDVLDPQYAESVRALILDLQSTAVALSLNFMGAGGGGGGGGVGH